MRQLVINAIGILLERNSLDRFAIDYATLENERNQQELGRTRLTTAFGETVLSQQTVDEILESLPDFEWATVHSNEPQVHVNYTYATYSTTTGTTASTDNHT